VYVSGDERVGAMNILRCLNKRDLLLNLLASFHDLFEVGMISPNFFAAFVQHALVFVPHDQNASLGEINLRMHFWTRV